MIMKVRWMNAVLAVLLLVTVVVSGCSQGTSSDEEATSTTEAEKIASEVEKAEAEKKAAEDATLKANEELEAAKAAEEEAKAAAEQAAQEKAEAQRLLDQAKTEEEKAAALKLLSESETAAKAAAQAAAEAKIQKEAVEKQALEKVAAEKSAAEAAAKAAAAAKALAAAQANKKVTLNVTFVSDNAAYPEFRAMWDGVLKKYKELKPNTTINLDIQSIPVSDHRTWITTQLIGGTAPDVFSSRYVWDQEDLAKGLIIDLTPFYKEKNPYANNVVWENQFPKSVLDQEKNPQNQYAGIPQSVNMVRILYNKSLFDKAGIMTLPKTWNEFLAVQKKLQENNIVPFAMPNTGLGDNVMNWVLRIFTDEVTMNEFKKFDYNGDGVFQQNEYAKGVDTGIINVTKSPFKDVFPIVKDWSRYWAKGSNALNSKAATDMFLRGDAAMMMGALSGFKAIRDTASKNFEVKAFPLPVLTTENHPTASGKLSELGSVPQMPLVIPTSIDKEKIDAAIDFMKYTTSPEVQKLVAEMFYLAPVISEVKMPKILDGFNLIGEQERLKLYAPVMDRTASDYIIQLSQLYLNGELALDEYMKKAQDKIVEGVKKLKETNSWSAENNYGIK